MLAIPHLFQVSFPYAKIDSKEAQKKSKAGICFGFTSHNKHTSFLLSKEAQAAKPVFHFGSTVRILQKSQETVKTGQTRTRERNREYKSRENAIKAIYLVLAKVIQTLKDKDLMIGKIQGQGFMGASTNLQGLEASPDGYK
ncbi:hypothetical protein Tco_0328445 [Tanacetum coccineum]